MQEILFYRELDFPLKTIQALLSSPNYNKEQALRDQKQLLILKKERLERLIAAIDGAAKGENVMNVFDSGELDQYKAEAQERWGHTDAYKEHREKTKHYGKGQWDQLAGEMDGIMAEFGTCMADGATPASAEAQRLVRKLQDHISAHYYNCTPQILAGLGQMYVADDRFRANIDRHGPGTAEFICQAILVYCGK
jgi:DNA-binding transcriptional MerR regulator